MGKDNKKFRGKKEKPEFDQKLLDLARVTRVVKGGRRFSFRATLVIGNRKGRVGVGVGKGPDASESIKKAFNDAKKNLINVTMKKGTILHELNYKSGSAKILIKPAAEGRGIVAGGAMRSVFDLAGIRDVVSKSFGTSNKLNLARATVEALNIFKNSQPRKKANKEE
jgi:small subunit ribosomal protein S5